MDLKEALKVVLKDESLEDYIYHVRESARETRSEEDKYESSWDLPRVKRFAEACKVLTEYYEAVCKGNHLSDFGGY